MYIASAAVNAQHRGRSRPQSRSRGRDHTPPLDTDEEQNGEGSSHTPPGQTAKPMWPTELKGDTVYERTRDLIWQIFENPEHNLVSQNVNLYILGLIVISTIVTVVETIPGLHRNDVEVWYGLESCFVINFTIEFVCRIVCCPDYGAFFSSGMNYIDVVSILPFYVDLIAGGLETDLSVLRVLRLGRSLRLIKLSRYSRGIRLVTNAMEQSIDALQLFFFLLSIVMVVCSSAIYYTERGDYNEVTGFWERVDPMTGNKGVSPFQSIPQSFWWCIVTLTTVGYGDAYPITYAGQFVGTITMLLGLIMLALPLSIIGTNFIEERANMIREMEEMKGGDGTAEEAQSLKSQLEETIDVINEVVKYQELISESMGDAIKIVAATRAEQMRRDRARETSRARETRTSRVVPFVPTMGNEQGSATTTGSQPSSATSSATEEGSGLGAGVGSDTSEVGGGVGVVSDEKTKLQPAPSDTDIPDLDLISVDAAVINALEVLCKNVIKCCTNTEKAIL